jgi:hypothetical protein
MKGQLKTGSDAEKPGAGAKGSPSGAASSKLLGKKDKKQK